MKKALAMILALVMVFSLGVSALAVDATTEHSTVTDSTTGLTVLVSKGVENLEFVTPTHGTTYEISSTVADYFPQSFSLMFSTGTGVTVTSSDPNVHFEFTNPVSDGYGAVNMGTGAATLTVTNANGSFTIYCPAPEYDVTGAAGIVAYLPAPAQFVNEGVTTGGWGDAFTSTAGSLKPLVNGNSQTGVSLGSFGGYVVLDFGTPAKDTSGNVTSGIYNDPTNAHGVDFILYGNALSTWAEPGCVQVSQDGTTWYDIAGSLHYRVPAMTAATDTNGDTFAVTSAGAIWDYTATYTDPTPADQTANTTAASNLGTYPSNPLFTYSAVTRPGSNALTGNSKVAYNAWHRHTWFPLTCNYFVNRTTQDTQGDLIGKALANLSMASSFKVVKGTNTANAMTLQFTGVRLMPVTNSSYVGSTTPDDFLFGYADCHINGTPSGAQANPYTTGRSTGGDPIDISWAVYPAGSTDSTGKDISGHPVSLTAIRYVRVYTGVQQMNGIMGESSTEITAAYRAETTGTGAASTAPTVKVGSSTVATTNMDVATTKVYSATTKVTVTSSAEKIFVNGTQVSSGDEVTISTPTSSTNYVQIITQSGTESPYITLLKITR